MAKYILGLEVGNSNIKLLECRKKGMHFIIDKAQVIPTPEGAIVDGIINNITDVYEVIREVIKKEKYKAKDIIAVIKSSEIITRDIKMDIMPRKDMEAILALQYQEHLLVDISRYQVAHKVMEKTQENATEQEILIVAAPNRIIDPLLQVATKLKMKMQCINIASDAITSILSCANPITTILEKEVMIVDLGGKSTTVTIVSNGVGVLTKDIPFGLDAINPLIMREFGVENREDIEKFKIQHAGIYEEDQEKTNEEDYGQYISSIIKPMMEYQLISEIKRFLQFHFSRNQNESIDKVYIIGGGSYLKNIDQYMTSVLGIPCVSGIEFNEAQVTYNDGFTDKSAYFANLLGLVNECWR